MGVTRWFDGHLDLTYVTDHGRDLTLDNTGGRSGDGAPPLLSFASLHAAGVRRACSTIFVRRRKEGIEGPYCFDTAEEAFQAGMRQVAMHRAWEQAGFVWNAEGDTRQGKGLGVTLAIEGAGCLRTVDDVEPFWQAGVRMVALAWAEGNAWSGGDQSGGDVTASGRKLLERIDALGGVHDVSHLSEQAFWTVMGEAQGPVVASHSNCRGLLPGAAFPERHLADGQIRALAARGGIIGVNLFARFLVRADELKAGRRATAADVVRHVEHIARVAGRRDCVALGSDMESGFGLELMPENVRGPGELARIAEGFSESGWSDQEVAGFAWGNWERLLGSRS